MLNTLRQAKSSLSNVAKNSKAYWNLNTCTSPPIIVYQMGKVGSSSIRHSLELSGVYPVFHTHSIGPSNQGTFVSRILYNDIIAQGKEAKFISLVREPIGRNISAFFENFKRDTGVSYEKSNFTNQELTELFLKSYDHSIPLKWFDNNVKDILGIDVYEYPFEEKGILIIQNSNFSLLIIKSETDNYIKEKSIANFLDINDFKVVNANEGMKKTYSKTYQSFLKDVKLPKSYIEEMCDSRYFRHFYSGDEIKSVMSKWMRSNEL